MVCTTLTVQAAQNPAYPWIVDATGFVSQEYPDEVQLLALYENKAIEGHGVGTVRFYTYKLEGGTCYYVERFYDILCPETTRWNLKIREKMLPAGFGLYNFGCISSSYCPDSGCLQTCPSGWVQVSYLTDIPIRAYSSTLPALPNVTVTPMNGALNIKWDPVTNVDVFSYYVAVLDGTNFVEVGDTEKTLRDITIGNLTNGKTYTVRVAAVSHSNVVGQVAQKTAIPVLPGIGTLEISSTPAGARVFIDGADAQKVTPATITNLSSGDHTYKLVLSKYKDASGTFTIEAGKTTTVTVPLKKAEAKAGAGMFLGISLLGLGVLGAVVIATREKKPEYTLPGYKGG